MSMTADVNGSSSIFSKWLIFIWKNKAPNIFRRWKITSTKNLMPKNFVHVLNIAYIFRHFIYFAPKVFAIVLLLPLPCLRWEYSFWFVENTRVRLIKLKTSMSCHHISLTVLFTHFEINPLEKKKCDKFSIYMGSVTKDGVEMSTSTKFEEGDVVTIT